MRALARERGLPTADKAESQEICFVPDGDYAAFVERQDPQAGRSRARSGTPTGRVLGTPRRASIASRSGSGRGWASAHRGPSTSCAWCPRSARWWWATRGRLEGTTLVADEVNWLSIPPPTAPLRAAVKIRYRHAEAPATIEPLHEQRVRVTFDAPQRAITPGQAAVFYDGDVCLGGGFIARP